MVSFCGHKFKVHYWPGFTCLWFFITFCTTLAISVSLKHIYWFFPYISDTGSISPESCIFGQLVNIGAAFLSVVVYIRYREVEAAINAGFIQVSHKRNNVSVWLGWISCLGLSLVANFQQTATHVSFLHFIGALGSFGVAGVYFIVQTTISYHYTLSNYTSTGCKFGLGRKIFYLRIFLSVFFLPLYFVCTVCAAIAASRFTGDTIIYWTPNDGAFEIRLVATFSEWILVIFQMIYILSFTKEFRNIRFREITFECTFTKMELQPI